MRAVYARRPASARLAGRRELRAPRHTFASRPVASGVDLRAVQELDGRRTLSMVQRYAHLPPGHLAAAVEKIVATPVVDGRKRSRSSAERRQRGFLDVRSETRK